MNATCPCRGCPRRTEECHAGCPDYRQWKQDREAVNAHRVNDGGIYTVMETAARNQRFRRAGRGGRRNEYET